MPDLPNELILYIIECLIPSRPPMILPPGHPVTRTLISLTLTSKFTHQVSRQLLFKFCLYIDSSQRLHDFLSASQKLLLPESPTEGPGLLLTQARSLFLAPFPINSLDEPHTVRQVDQLSSHLCGNLRRLVIDMPLRYLYPEEDSQGLRTILRKAFCRLTILEEFCSVQDELYCDTHETEYEPEVWSNWPRLRRLALYNVCIHEGFLQGLQQCTSLTHLVLTRPEPLTDPLPSDLSVLLLCPLLERVMIVNTEEHHEMETRRRDPGWRTSFWGQLLLSQHSYRSEPVCESNQAEPLLVYATVPVTLGREDEVIELCQEWVCSHALDGSLWNFPGTPYRLEDV